MDNLKVVFCGEGLSKHHTKSEPTEELTGKHKNQNFHKVNNKTEI